MNSTRLRTVPLTAVLLAAVTAPALVSARPGAVTGPASVIEKPGEILAASTGDDGSVLLAGWFTRVAGSAAPGVARLKASGQPDPQFSSGVGIGAPVSVRAPGSSASVAAPCPVFLELPGGGFVIGDPPLFGDPAMPGIQFWFVVDPVGLVTPDALPSVDPDEWVMPQFVEDGKLIAIVSGPGGPNRQVKSKVRRLRLDTGLDDAGFSPSLSGTPLQARPAGSGRLWVLEQMTGTQRLLQLQDSGAVSPGFAPVSVPAANSSLQPLASGAVATTVSQMEWSDGAVAWEWRHRVQWYNDNGSAGARREITGGAAPYYVEPEGSLLRERSLPDGASPLSSDVRPRLLFRELPNGEADGAFHPLLTQRLIHRLTDGRWQVDGTRRYLADGTPDPAWSAPAVLNHGSVSSLFAAPGGAVIGIGDFSLVDGQPRPGIARWRSDGVLDSAFVPSAAEGGVLDCAVASDSSVLLLRGGSLQRLLPDGSRDAAFHVWTEDPFPVFQLDAWEELEPRPSGGWLGLTAGHVVTIGPDGKCTILRASGVTAGKGLMVLPDGRYFHAGRRWLADGGLDVSFRPPGGLGSVPLCSLPSRQWLFLQVPGTQETLTLLNDDGSEAAQLPGRDAAAPGAAGTFYTVSGGLVTRFHSRGRRDATFSPVPLERRNESIPEGLPLLSAAQNGGRGNVSALLVNPVTGELWVAGDFTRAGGVLRSGLAILDAVQPATFSAWNAAMYSGQEPLPAGDADTDGDGLTSFQEYAAGTDPAVPDAASAQAEIITTSPLSLQVPLNPAATDVVRMVEVSSDLTHWRAAGVDEAVLTRSAGGVSVFELAPVAGMRFVRVRYQSLP